MRMNEEQQEVSRKPPACHLSMCAYLDDVPLGSAHIGDLVLTAGLQGHCSGHLSGRGPHHRGSHGTITLHGRVGLGHVTAGTHVHISALGMEEKKRALVRLGWQFQRRFDYQMYPW